MALQFDKSMLWRDALTISTVIFGAGATLLRKTATSKIHPFQFEAITGTTHAIIGWLCLYYAINNGLAGDVKPAGVGWAISQSLFSCATGISFMYLIRSGAGIGYSSTVTSTAITALTILGARFLLGEVLSPRMLVGAAIMLIGIGIATCR